MVHPTNEFAAEAIEALEQNGIDVEEDPVPPLKVCREGARCTQKEAEAAWSIDKLGVEAGCPYCFQLSIFDRITDEQIAYECEERLHS
jgi:hypothetical protein